MKDIEEEILKFFESLDRSKFVFEEYRFDVDLDEPVP